MEIGVGQPRRGFTQSFLALQNNNDSDINTEASTEPSDEEIPVQTSQRNLFNFMFVMMLSGATQGYMDYSNQAAALYNVQY